MLRICNQKILLFDFERRVCWHVTNNWSEYGNNDTVLIRVKNKVLKPSSFINYIIEQENANRW